MEEGETLARKTILFALAGVLAVGAYWYTAAGRSDTEVARARAVEEKTAPPPGAVESSAARTRTSSQAGRRLGQPRSEPDLYDLVTTLLPRSEAGDAQASRTIAAAYLDCWQYAVNPIGFDEDIRLKSRLREDLAPKLSNARDTIVKRCGRFAGQKIGPTAIRAMLNRAAEQGDLASQVQLFSERSIRAGGASAEDITPVVDRVLASRDAEAYAAIAPLMGRVSAGAQSGLAPIPAGTDLAEAAWNIAACRLGRDCGPNSSAVLQMCLGGGVNCELRHIESFYTQAVLPPADQARLRQLIQQLVQGSKS